jgi:hypothetical protein
MKATFIFPTFYFEADCYDITTTTDTDLQNGLQGITNAEIRVSITGLTAVSYKDVLNSLCNINLRHEDGLDAKTKIFTNAVFKKLERVSYDGSDLDTLYGYVGAQTPWYSDSESAVAEFEYVDPTPKPLTKLDNIVADTYSSIAKLREGLEAIRNEEANHDIILIIEGRDEQNNTSRLESDCFEFKIQPSCSIADIVKLCIKVKADLVTRCDKVVFIIDSHWPSTEQSS